MRIQSLLALLVLCYGCTTSPPPEMIRPVRALQLQKKQWVNFSAFPGRTRAIDRVNLSFRVEGQLIERPVFVGDHVLKDELLARLDPKDFEVKLQSAVGKLERAEADLRFAERDYERGVRIKKEDPGAISDSLIEQKEEAQNRLKGEVKALKAEVQQAEDQLSYTYLRTPYEGMVVATYIQNYEYVRAKQPVIRLLNTSQVEMVIDVPESMIVSVGSVERIVVEFDAIPGQSFSATIKEIGTEASTTTRTFPVTLLVEQPAEETIYSGMAGNAFLFSSTSQKEEEEGFLVPASALFTDADLKTTYLWVVEEPTLRVHRVEVNKGTLTSQGVMVTGPLKEGEWIVTSGVSYLQEGKEVRLLPVQLNDAGEQVPLSESA